MSDDAATPKPDQAFLRPSQTEPAIPGQAAQSDTGTSLAGLPIHDLADLLRGGTEALIRHDGQLYSLRLTRANKLLLTK